MQAVEQNQLENTENVSSSHHGFYATSAIQHKL